MTERTSKFIQWVADFYNWQLLHCKEAMDYLLPRLPYRLLIDEFHLGLAGSYNELTKTIEKSYPFHMDIAEELGLCKAKDGRNYDFFRERIMFPIHDEHGNLIGFSGRGFVGDVQVKYMNSPNSYLFNKREIVFNLHRAIPAIEKRGFVFLVEGFFDVLALHGHMHENVVASMGTAFGDSHADILASYTDKVVIAYDSDPAGVDATIKVATLLKRKGFKVKIACFPKGMDPASYAQEHIDMRPLGKRVSLEEFEYEKALDDMEKFPTEYQRIQYATETLPLILKGTSRATYEPLFMRTARLIDGNWASYRATLEDKGFTFNEKTSSSREVNRFVPSSYEFHLMFEGERVYTTSSIIKYYAFYTAISWGRMTPKEATEVANMAQALHEADLYSLPETIIFEFLIGNTEMLRGKTVHEQHALLCDYYIRRPFEEDTNE